MLTSSSTRSGNSAANSSSAFSPQWLRFGEGEGAAPRLRQDSAGYRVEPGWVAKKYEALNDAHKKMAVEIILALLRLEGKR